MSDNLDHKSRALSPQAQFFKDLQTIPNLLSLSRIFMTFVAAGLYLTGYGSAGLIVGAIAGFTDFLDGWLARKLDQSTDMGALLDRLSDLVIETVAFACLLYYGLLAPVYFIIYLTREYIVITARLYASERGETLPSSFFGKRKTNLIMGSFIPLFAAHSGLISMEHSDLAYKIGFAMVIGGLIASYISGAQYIAGFMKIYGKEPLSK